MQEEQLRGFIAAPQKKQAAKEVSTIKKIGALLLASIVSACTETPQTTPTQPEKICMPCFKTNNDSPKEEKERCTGIPKDDNGNLDETTQPYCLDITSSTTSYHANKIEKRTSTHRMRFDPLSCHIEDGFYFCKPDQLPHYAHTSNPLTWITKTSANSWDKRENDRFDNKPVIRVFFPNEHEGLNSSNLGSYPLIHKTIPVITYVDNVAPPIIKKPFYNSRDERIGHYDFDEIDIAKSVMLYEERNQLGIDHEKSDIHPLILPKAGTYECSFTDLKMIAHRLVSVDSVGKISPVRCVYLGPESKIFENNITDTDNGKLDPRNDVCQQTPTCE